MKGHEKSKLQALTEIAAIDITLDFSEILQHILKITCETMNSHSGTIMLVGDDTSELRMVASYNLGHDYIDRVYEASKKAGVDITSSPSGMVLQTGKYYPVPNVFEEPRDRPWYDLTRELGFSAQIFTPMKRGHKVIGLLNVYMAEPHQFTDEEINFVNIAATQATSVVQNARLCTRLKNNIHELNQYKGHLEDNIQETYRKLYDSEKYLRTIIESSIDGIAVLSEQGKIEYSNDSFFDIIGWPREELSGRSFIKMLTDDIKEFYLKKWHEVRNNIGPDEITVERKITTKNGKIRYLVVSRVTVVINEEKKFILFVKNISQRKKLELNLKESEKKHRDLFENANDPMYTLDSVGTILTMNKAGIESLGCTKEEVIGTNISQWLSQESCKIVQERRKRRSLGVANDQTDLLEVVCKNGEHRWAEVRTRDIKKDEGTIEIHGIARDVTEKRELEKKIDEYHKKLKESYEELKKTETKYHDLFENANDSIYIYDADGYFKEVNNTALELLGCTKEELIGTHISEWITPESLRTTQENLKKRISGEPADKPFVLEVICKNGEHKWMEIRRRLVKDGDRVTAVHGIGRDITEKKKLEQGLKESEAKYRDLFEKANDAIFIHNMEGYFQKINAAGLKILGCTEEEVIGSHISRWLTPESFIEAKENFNRAVSGEKLKFPIIHEVVTSTGEHRFIEVNGRLIIKEGEITGVHGVARDITEKRKLEQKVEEYNERLKKSYEELKQTEAKYRELFENAQDPMYTHDTRGYILSVNLATLKELGCTKEDIIGSHISRWLTPESFQYAQTTLMNHAQGKPVKQPIILEVVTKDGEHRWAEIRNRIITDGDIVKEIHGIARDITEKVKMEQKLSKYHEELEKSYQELKELDGMKNEFISNMTHELLTPLTSIKGFTELMADGTLGDISDKQKDGLEIILRNSERLGRLIKELLDSTQMENEKTELDLKPVSMNTVISKTVQDVQLQAKKKHIDITQDVRPLPEIRADGDKLAQIIINVLSNAIKFTPVNGKINIKGREEPDVIKISITDTGIGIPPEKLPYIFDRFYQADGSAKRKFGGVGLGLWICRGLIEKHKGSIWAESDGNGSTFHIVLPKLTNSIMSDT